MIRTKDQLIEWLENNITNPIHRWSIENNAVEVLGFFEHSDVKGFAGFKIKLVSKHHQVYYFIITLYDFGRNCSCLLISKPQWRFWNPENSTNPLFAGDNPTKYKELRDAAQKIHKAKKDTGTDTPPDRG